ncbi:MAG: single-stranded-DNA-specific exonuclease RecJ [Anaerolineae bacterium]|nr:single-stranded-DNA-specific exonuclease RecJ [Anaerolineae bacterium]
MSTRSWIEPTPHEVPEAILNACERDPLLAQILVGRGWADPERIRAFLDPILYDPTPPESLPDLEKASALLVDLVGRGGKVLIWGDFDVDGQTATALLYDGLTGLGAQAVYHVPHRQHDGHGIRRDRLQELLDQHQPDLLLTCDTGITEYEAVEDAQMRGIPVIVTDHHNLGDRLPKAKAVINPKRLAQSDPEHPLISLPGVGVAYKLMQHVYASLNRSREVSRMLDLVALGIVADVAAQVNDTRFLLQIGLNHLRQAERVGLAALMAVINLEPERLTAEQIGFQIGPRLNAAGRLGDASVAVELLTTKDSARAALIAQQMEGLNAERRLISKQVEAAAQEMVNQNPSLLDHAALVLYHPAWHSGILGIAANRLAERYHRPVVLLCGEGPIVGGSARSFGGYDIGAAIEAQSELLTRHGGHAGAAGLALPLDRVERFRRGVSKSLIDLGASEEPPPLVVDLTLPLSEINPNLVYRIEKLSPFGEGNPPVVIAASGVHLSHLATVGREGRHRKMVIEDEQGATLPIMWWDGAEEPEPKGRFDIAFTLSTDRDGDAQGEILELREWGDAPAPEIAPSEIGIHDWRRDPNPMGRLEALIASQPDLQVWAEAYPRQDHPHFRRRADLHPSSTLAIFSAPSDPASLKQTLMLVQPVEVHVFGVEPPLQKIEVFLKTLLTAAKNVISHLEGKTDLDVLCGAVAGSQGSVKAGLAYLAAEGKITIQTLNDQEVCLSADETLPAPKVALKSHLEVLKRALDESAAYRRFFRIVPLRSILHRHKVQDA